MSNDTDALSNEDIMLMTIWGEARGEPHEGKMAVAAVIMNRVKADVNHDNLPDWWGEGVRAVCLKPYQFSCWLESDPNRSKIMAITDETPGYVECLGVAVLAINGSLPDPTDGCDSYYAKGSKVPRWARNLTPWAEIGKHLFFRTI